MKKLNRYLIAILLVLLPTTILLWNLEFPMTNTQTTLEYESNQQFGIIVDEFHWDESRMPKGKRSPKGVLYKPETL